MAQFLAVDHDPFSGAVNQYKSETLWPTRLLQSVWSAVRPEYLKEPVLQNVDPGMVGKVPQNQIDPYGASVGAAIDLASTFTPAGVAKAAALPLMGMAAKRAMPTAEKTGIRAYHGSPHDFDRFDLSKIGTGEGAQSYGHGLYFAENEGTARSYRDALAPPPVPKIEISEGSAKSHPGFWELQPRLSHYMTELKDREAAIAAARKGITETLKHIEAGRISGNPDVYQDALRLIDDGLINIKMPSPGRMYEVNINARPEQFLDWDKPLSAQPQIVQDMARSSDLSHLKPGNRTRRQIEMWRDGSIINPADEPTGNVLHSALTDYGADSASNAALTGRFREVGIPGIRYLDQGSRGIGEGSRNYVVFDDSIIEILRKYGIAGLAALPPATAMAIRDRMTPVDHDPFVQ